MSSIKKSSHKKTILSLAARKDLAKKIILVLRVAYPDAKTELDFRNPFELLVATMLSAQATDVSVNAATPALFKKFSDAKSLASASVSDVEKYIRSIGLYRTKAKNIVASARILCEQHGGHVPDDPTALQLLPGVGLKTVSVVLSNAYGRPAIAVDTHVGRLARRLGLSSNINPDKVQADLQTLFLESDWIFVHHALILHGRRVCKARIPDCANCDLMQFCPRFGL